MSRTSAKLSARRLIVAIVALWWLCVTALLVGEMVEALSTTLLTQDVRDLFRDVDDVAAYSRVVLWTRFLYLIIVPALIVFAVFLAFSWVRNGSAPPDNDPGHATQIPSQLAEARISGSPIVLTKLTAGSFGLAVTYWLFGVGGGLFFGALIAIIQPQPGSTVARSLVLCAAILLAPVLLGIWRAAGSYPGRKAWATLARAAVGLSVALFYFPFLVILVAG